MKLRPLILDANSHAEIQRVIHYADAHRYNLHDLLAIVKGNRPAPGDHAEFTCVVPLGYRCVFTIDQHPGGDWCRHLSVSVLGDGQAPSPDAVFALAKEFGITGKILHIDHEPFGPDKIAVSLWAFLQPP